MDAQVTKARPITIAVVALGGEGGGVLADWIIDCPLRGSKPSPSGEAKGR